MRFIDLSVFHTFGFEDNISDTASPAPKRRHNCLKGLSVIPAIGATIKLFSSW
ncbi:hypothetical protein PRUB_a1807 [Pseudoalteromonas rubra]|uniref:Uncharacterized protein n=1 Tax=Pseudoalteromonas rubra TaxID=43658 RepID=A0A8T0CDH2_9GAMM|nr:hypothetical protein PRUB_a1807 [Pseudoalteromonas rubra]